MSQLHTELLRFAELLEGRGIEAKVVERPGSPLMLVAKPHGKVHVRLTEGFVVEVDYGRGTPRVEGEFSKTLGGAERLFAEMVAKYRAQGFGTARQNPTASRSETAARLLVSCIAQHGTLQARVWIPKSGSPRVYIGNAGYVTLSGSDVFGHRVQPGSRSAITLIESSLYPAQRATWKAGLASYRKAAAAANEEESAAALAQDDPAASRNDHIDATVLSAYKTLGHYDRQKIAAITGLDLFTLALAERRLKLPMPNPKARSNPSGSMREIEDIVGGMPSLLAATPLLKPPALALLHGGPKLFYWWVRGPKAWAVEVDASDDATAQKLGAKIQKGLVSKKNLSASDPYLHDLPLYVTHRNGWALVETAEAPAKAPSTKSNAKSDLSEKAKAYFGANGATVGGAEGRYVLAIKPALAKHKGLFAETSVRAATIEELDRKLDATIQKLDGLLASRR